MAISLLHGANKSERPNRVHRTRKLCAWHDQSSMSRLVSFVIYLYSKHCYELFLNSVLGSRDCVRHLWTLLMAKGINWTWGCFKGSLRKHKSLSVSYLNSWWNSKIRWVFLIKIYLTIFSEFLWIFHRWLSKGNKSSEWVSWTQLHINLVIKWCSNQSIQLESEIAAYHPLRQLITNEIKSLSLLLSPSLLICSNTCTSNWKP